MTIGQLARKILGKYFPVFGKMYRSIFVNLNTFAKSISPFIPPGALVVDVGGGDGQPLNYLLSLRDDIKVKLIDTSQHIGNAIKREYLDRIDLYPATSMKEFSYKVKWVPDVILVSDVIHHVAQEARKEFFSDLRELVGDGKQVHIIIKDIEPGYIRSLLSLMADRYISGDKRVSLVGRKDISYMITEAFENTVTIQETNLFLLDKPNYAMIIVYGRI